MFMWPFKKKKKPLFDDLKKGLAEADAYLAGGTSVAIPPLKVFDADGLFDSSRAVTIPGRKIPTRTFPASSSRRIRQTFDLAPGFVTHEPDQPISSRVDPESSLVAAMLTLEAVDALGHAAPPQTFGGDPDFKFQGFGGGDTGGGGASDSFAPAPAGTDPPACETSAPSAEPDTGTCETAASND